MLQLICICHHWNFPTPFFHRFYEQKKKKHTRGIWKSSTKKKGGSWLVWVMLFYAFYIACTRRGCCIVTPVCVEQETESLALIKRGNKSLEIFRVPQSSRMILQKIEKQPHSVFTLFNVWFFNKFFLCVFLWVDFN